MSAASSPLRRWFPWLRDNAERGRTGVASALALLAFLAGAAAVATAIDRRAGEAARLVAHSIDVRERAERLLGQVRDAESGQRGFLLTGIESYLESYRGGITTVLPGLGDIERLVLDNPAQVERIGEARRFAAEKFAELDQTITIMRDGDRTRAIAIVSEGRGEALMEGLRRVMREFQSAESALLNARIADEETQRRLGSLAILASLSAFGFVGWLHLRARQRESAALTHSNVELEARVAVRTQELDNERMRVEALLRDVNHRVGNNLAMVSALLNVQTRQSRDPAVRKALGQAQSRIQAIAAGQRRMRLDIETDEIEARPYFEDLLGELGKATDGRPITIELSLSDIRLPGRDAVSYVVLVNELVTNALKHAFPDGMAGRILVSIDPGAEAGTALVITVEDDGIGMPDDVLAGGLGQSVIASLTRGMRATSRVEAVAPGAERKGTRVTLCFPSKG